MQFQTQEDLEAPLDYVFRRASNFEAYERQALRKGAHVARRDGPGPVQVGSSWDVRFTFRNKERQMTATLAEFAAPQDIVVDTDAKGLASLSHVSFLALSAQTTRVTVKIDMSAKSLSARLLLQSLKLAKSNLEGRFRKRVREQLKGVEADFKRGV